MEPRDARGVTGLFRKVYGLSYPERYVYHPDSFSKLVDAGKILSVVTVTAQNRVVGHCAFVEKHEGMASIGMSLVDPEYRHSECQARMLVFLTNEACRRSFSGIWSVVTTNHVYAQRAGQRAGFKRVALILGQVPANRTYDGMPGDGRRMSVAYGYLRLEDHNDATLYPPRHHGEFIETIFRKTGLKRRFSRAPGEIPRSCDGDESLIRIRTIPGDKRAVIEICRYAPDVLYRTGRIMRSLLFKNFEQITLFLPLSRPLTAAICEEFERRGFFFAGVLPLSSVGDALVLQYFNSISIDYDRILVASDMLADIKTYVRDHDPNRLSEKPCAGV